MKTFILALLLSGCGVAGQVYVRDGTPGATGPTGSQGEQGDPGAKGATGATGASGTSVTAVQFCPGPGANYPTRFPEIGFCIGGKLYATYWDGHNAWSSEIPPGNYLSTSTGLACSFTVGPNCTIH